MSKKTHVPRQIVPVPTEDGGYALIETADFIKHDLKYKVFALDENGDLYHLWNGSIIYLKNQIIGVFGKVERITKDRTDMRRSNLRIAADE